MNQCLSCSKPCTETSAFCEECRSSLLHRVQYKATVDRVVQPQVAKNASSVHFPEENTQAATFEHEKFIPASPSTHRHRRGNVSGRRRKIFIVLSIVFVLTFLVNGVLLFIASHQLTHSSTAVPAVSSSIVKVSSTITTPVSVRATASPGGTVTPSAA